jgi:hypothetical protein
MTSSSLTALPATISNRRAFVTAATGCILITTLPAFAEGDKFDDLAMPTEEEAKKNEVRPNASMLWHSY